MAPRLFALHSVHFSVKALITLLDEGVCCCGGCGGEVVRVRELLRVRVHYASRRSLRSMFFFYFMCFFQFFFFFLRTGENNACVRITHTHTHIYEVNKEGK